MELKKLLFIGLLASSFTVSAQCYDDACDDDNDIPIPGCCLATTAGMTWSGYGDIGCVNMGTSTNPDTWMSFTAPTTGYIQITIDNITQNGITQFVVFDHQNAEVCASLNSFGLLAGEGCNDLPADGVGGVTSIDTVEYAVEAGERYWVLVSADVQNGATPGTFNLCIDVIPLPPPPPPQPGQDCVDAQVLCNDAQTGFYNGQLDLGDGLVEESTLLSSGCIGNETSSQWYTFTASESGTFEMMITPDAYAYSSSQGGTYTGDDFDWELYDVTAGCGANAVSLACDYSGAKGSTGFSATDAAGWGQVADTDYQTVNGPGDGSPQWNTTNVSLVAGNTYAIIIQNYSNSLGGMTATFQGGAVLGPTDATAQFDAVLDQTNCEATLTLTNNTGIPNYTYNWDFGDGTTATGANQGDHFYGTPGTYIVTLEVTDPLGCVVSYQRIIDVADCTPIPLPAGIGSFVAEVNAPIVNLYWTTETEIDVDYFIVQKSQDLSNWIEVDRQNGFGDSEVEQEYSSRDKTPFDGVSYYRLKQVDYNGSANYSAVRSVKFNKDSNVIKIVNVHGQEVDESYHGVVYYMYADGTSKAITQ